MELTVVPWPDLDFYGDGIPNTKRHLTVKLDGQLLRHKEFFESADKPYVVYCFHYICDHDDGDGKKYKCLHAGVFDRKSRIEQESWGSYEIRHFDLRSRTLTLQRLPDFKERNLKAEAAEEVWNKFPSSVHEKYLAQAAPCERNKDSTPNFRMIGVTGSADLMEELTVMKADYYGEYMPHPKFPIEQRIAFKDEQKAIDTFFENPQAWLVHKWDGKRWLQAATKKSKDGKGRIVVWQADS